MNRNTLFTGRRAVRAKAAEVSEAAIRSGDVGSFLNVAGEDANRYQHSRSSNRALKIPLMFGLDVIHGYRTCFRSRWHSRQRGIRGWSNEALPWRQPRRGPTACAGLSRRWSTSPAMRGGAGSRRAPGRIRSWAPPWPPPMSAASRAPRSRPRPHCSPASSTSSAMVRPRAGAITTPPRSRSACCATSTCRRSGPASKTVRPR